MPRYVRSPEDLLRASGADVYFVRFTAGLSAFESGADPAGKADLEAWLKVHVPDARLALIGPSEFSGVLCGGIGSDYALLTDTAGIEAFAAVWEDSEGASLDDRFQCYLYPYREYERRLALHGDPRSWDD